MLNKESENKKRLNYKKNKKKRISKKVHQRMEKTTTLKDF